ncbi:MAG: type II toxin-antitoxin system VapC family toxin [Cellvibrio sp.]|uniref:PIN domain-containing protein n=1 Tax=Cellvibrio sp. TaxID=1965322 RepID=UPI0031AF3321
MIGLDTNVVIRYLTQDDAKQSAIANRIIEQELNEKNQGYITLISLIEITWVLESCYEQTKDDVINVLDSLLTIKQITIEKTDLVYLALKRFRSGNADFSDALIALVCENAGCKRVVSFDKKAATVGMEKI